MLAMTLGLVIQSTPINVESPGIRLVNLIPKLASEARLSLSVVPYLENDVVAIRTMGRPWEEVKSNLAKVLNATWEEKDGRFVLTQTSEQQKQDLDARYGCIASKIRRLKEELAPHYAAEAWSETQFGTWLARVTKSFEPEQSLATRLPEMIWQRRSEPTGRFMSRLFNGIEPREFLKVGPTLEHHPFSDLQIPLHAQISVPTSAILASLNSEVEMVRSLPGFDWKNSQPSKTIRNAAHWQLKLTEAGADALIANVTLLDSRGESCQTISEFSNFPVPKLFEAMRGKPKLTEFAQIRLRDASKLDSSYNDGATAQQIEAGNKERLEAIGFVRELCIQWSKSEREDPLGYLGGDGWRLFSEESGKPMLSLLSDDGSNEVVTPQSPASTGGTYRADTMGWIIGMQRDPYYVRQNRVDRRGMGWLFNALASDWKSGRFGVDNTSRRIELGAAAWRLQLSRMPAALQLASTITSPAEVKGLGILFATLPEGSRNSLSRGGVLPIARQNDETRRIFREGFYLSGELKELDPRIAAVAFPKVDDGMMLSGSTERKSGFEVVYPPRLGFEAALRRNFLSFDEMARWFASGKIKPETEVAEATQENLSLFLYYQGVGKSTKRLTETYPGKPVLKATMTKIGELAPALRNRLLERGQELLRAKPDGD
jgi:hypothetical protein